MDSDKKSEDKKEKIHSIKHFYIDFRRMLLKAKIEKIVMDDKIEYGCKEKDRKFRILPEDELYSEFDVSRFFEALNTVYGKDIEK